MKLSVKNGKQYSIFLVLCVHLYISNPYITETKVICDKKIVFIYYWGILRVFYYGETGEIIQKMTKSLPIREPPPPLPPTNFYPFCIKNLSTPYYYLKWYIKVSEKVIKVLSNRKNQFSACSPHFNNTKE